MEYDEGNCLQKPRLFLSLRRYRASSAKGRAMNLIVGFADTLTPHSSLLIRHS